MKRLLAISIFLFVVTSASLGQTFGDNPSFKDRIFTGGSFGASFGTVTFVSVSPILGYMISPRLSAGVGVMYQYVKDDRYVPSLERNDWGTSVFTRFLVVPPLFLHAEYEYLNYDYIDSRLGFNSFMAGGGVAQPIGRNASFIAMVLYNFSYVNDNTTIQPYSDPWIVRIGITAGF